MKYEKNILEAFNYYKLSPRNGQVETINLILTEYLDNKKKYVILSASTGIGKSIIAIIVSYVISKIENIDMKQCELLSHTNILSEQYKKSFSVFGDDFEMIQGASNYYCKVLNDTAENCLIKEKKTLPSCSNCEYLLSRKNKNKCKNLITNYSYYFLDKFFTLSLEDRLITVFDEAHLINDTFSSSFETTISKSNVELMCNKLKNNPTKNSISFISKLEKFSKDFIYEYEEDELDELGKNISDFFLIISDIIAEYGKVTSDAVEAQNYQEFVQYNKIYNYFNNKKRTYDNFIGNIIATDNYVANTNEFEIGYKPIFIKNMFNSYLDTSKYILLMSATITKEFIEETINIDKNKIAFIYAMSKFPKESKKVLFLNHASYNYKALLDNGFKNDILKIIKNILLKHKEDNGIILTPSFSINKFIANGIKTYKILEHESGTNLKDIIHKFKNSPNHKILISPSAYEGVDLPDDISRYTIVVKAPYASLADKRIQVIFNKYKKVYQLQTLFKCIQAFGRSTRSENDYSTIYCLDSNITKLFKSKENIWKNEFLYN